MIDDLLLNFSALNLQAFRQFLPIPPVALSVITGADMNVLNIYNTYYAQHPNMSYRLMGLWYSGISFVLTLGLMSYAFRLVFNSNTKYQCIAIVSLSIFLFGALTHLPIMHRDYFYIPGYALGYKITVGYLGFILIIILLMRNIFNSRVYLKLKNRTKAKIWKYTVTYFCFAAIFRASLGELPNQFSW